MAYKHSRRATRIPFQAFGTDRPLLLDIAGAVGWHLVKLEVFMRGQFVFAGVTTSGTSQGENPAGLIQRVTVEATPKGDSIYQPGGRICSLTPRSILRQYIFDKGRFLTDPNGPISGATGTYQVDTRLPIFFAQPRLAKPMETSLRLDQYQQIIVTVSTGTVAAMLVGNNATSVDPSGAYIEIVEHREYAPDFFPLGTIYQDDLQQQLVAAANPQLQFNQFPVTEAYLSALVYAEGVSTSYALEDTVVNRVYEFQDVEMFGSRYNQMVREENRDIVYDPNTSLTGLYYLEFAQPAERMLLRGAVPNMNLAFDVSNPSGSNNDRITILNRRVRAVPVKQPQKKSASTAA